MNLRTRLDRIQPLSARPVSDLSDAELDAEITRLLPKAAIGAPPEIAAIIARWPACCADVAADDMTTMLRWAKQAVADHQAAGGHPGKSVGVET